MPGAGVHEGWALDLLAGDRTDFVERLWGREVHHRHADPERLIAQFSLADADQLLTSSAIRTPALRLVQDGKILPESSYTRPATLAGRSLTGLVDARKALELFDGGATIVFQGLHRYWPPLAGLIADLERALGHPCQANAYLTPPSGQGFAVHADSHDVFVFQTHGHKRWELHGSAEPLDDPGTNPPEVSTRPPNQDVDPQPTEVVLEPGLVLYLPTGTRHAARAEEAMSLHVTVGINQLTWPDLLRRSIEPLLTADSTTHLPAGYLDDPQPLRDELADRLIALAERVRALNPDDLVRAEQQRFLSTRLHRLSGALVDRSTEIDDHTPLRRRGDCRPQPVRGDRLVLLLGDRTLTVPAWLGPAIDRIRAATIFTPADLADELDEASRLVLCRRLLREGTLTLEPHAGTQHRSAPHPRPGP